MKKQKPCDHSWEDLYLFKTTDGKHYMQQRCVFCKINRYLPVGEIHQNGSKTEQEVQIK